MLAEWVHQATKRQCVLRFQNKWLRHFESGQPYRRALQSPRATRCAILFGLTKVLDAKPLRKNTKDLPKTEFNHSVGWSIAWYKYYNRQRLLVRSVEPLRTRNYQLNCLFSVVRSALDAMVLFLSNKSDAFQSQLSFLKWSPCRWKEYEYQYIYMYDPLNTNMTMENHHL